MVKRAIFERKNVLVVGGAGFIGSHLCTELVRQSKVICVDNFTTGSEENIDHLLNNPYFRFIRHDMSAPLDFTKFSELESFQIEFQGIQEIYNCACPTSSKHFEKFYLETLLANSYVVKNALDIAVMHQAKFLHLSTSAVYGDPLDFQTSFSESYWGFVNPVGLRSCYNEGKRFAETFVSTYRRRYNVDAKIARLFNVYGPNMRSDSGRMIPDMIKQASENNDVVIYGDGTEQKSYCYVSDIVDGLLKFMQSQEMGPMNFGSTELFSIRFIAERIIQVLGSPSKFLYEPPLPAITRQVVPDISLAKNRLGWYPIVRLADGLSRTIQEMAAKKVLRFTDFTNKGTSSSS